MVGKSQAVPGLEAFQKQPLKQQKKQQHQPMQQPHEEGPFNVCCGIQNPRDAKPRHPKTAAFMPLQQNAAASPWDPCTNGMDSVPVEQQTREIMAAAFHIQQQLQKESKSSYAYEDQAASKLNAVTSPASVCAAIMMSEMQRLDQRLDEWIAKVDTNLERFLMQSAGPHQAHAYHKEGSLVRCDMTNGSNHHDPALESSPSMTDPIKKDGGNAYHLKTIPTRIRKSVKDRESYTDHFSKVINSNDLHAATEHLEKPKTLLYSVVHNPLFDYTVLSVVAINSLLVGASVQHNSQNLDPNKTFKILEYLCSLFFIIELSCRIKGLGWRYLCNGYYKKWTFFDVFLVGVSVLDFTLSVLVGEKKGNMSVIKFMKVLKLIKIMRLLRIIHFLQELRVMAMMIVHSLLSLFWLMCLLVVLLYTVAVVITQGSTEWLREGGELDEEPAYYTEAVDAYGSLFKTMYTLFAAMTGGVNWADVAKPCMEFGEFYFLVFLLYIFFSMFSMLNIVTGIFVDGALQASQRDRNLVMLKQKKFYSDQARQLLILLEEIDTNRTGFVDAALLAEALSSEKIQAVFNNLAPEMHEVAELAEMLDQTGDGQIEIKEFVDGLLHFRVEPKNFDIQMLIRENRQAINLIKSTAR